MTAKPQSLHKKLVRKETHKQLVLNTLQLFICYSRSKHI